MTSKTETDANGNEAYKSEDSVKFERSFGSLVISPPSYDHCGLADVCRLSVYAFYGKFCWRIGRMLRAIFSKNLESLQIDQKPVKSMIYCIFNQHITY